MRKLHEAVAQAVAQGFAPDNSAMGLQDLVGMLQLALDKNAALERANVKLVGECGELTSKVAMCMRLLVDKKEQI